MLKLTKQDIKGVISMPPTPSTNDGGNWRTADSVDHDKSRLMVNKLINSGTKGFAFCGTTGENAALLWEEKKGFISTVTQEIKHRAIVFAGATSLGTREVIRQMKLLKELGADGAFVGLPLWQTPTLTNSVDFYADLSAAVPDMPILVYSNFHFFKSDFPVEFWEGLAKKAPTVVCDKISHGIEHITDDIRVAGHQINFIPAMATAYQVNKRAPGKVTSLWCTDPGPEPYVALLDAIVSGNEAKAEEVVKDLRSLPSAEPPSAEPHAVPSGWQGRMQTPHAQYNAQEVRYRWNCSDFLNVGPMRPPYTDFPDERKKGIEIRTKAYSQLRQKYLTAGAR